MDAQTCLQKMKQAGTLALATVDEEGAPQIRSVSALHYEPDALYFFTGKGKEMSLQLKRDGRLQTLVLTPANEMIRLTGIAREADECDQRAYIDAIFEEQPYMDSIYPGGTRYEAGLIFKIEQISLDYFNLGVRPIERGHFALTAAPKEKGYRITDACISCGACVQSCPQSCIEAGEKMRIRPEHCLHCGSCAAVCPVSAVERIS